MTGTGAVPARRRGLRGLRGAIVAVYVVPVLATVVLLSAVGLWELAVALAVLEIGTVAATRWAMAPRPERTDVPARLPGQPVLGRPGAPRPTPNGAGLRVTLAIVGVALAVALITLLGTEFGR